jgi:hypothetical protein
MNIISKYMCKDNSVPESQSRVLNVSQYYKYFEAIENKRGKITHVETK